MIPNGTSILVGREAELVQSVLDATSSLDAEAGYFMVRVQDRGKDVHHVLIACDPRWGVEYEACDGSSNDPWFRYAAGNSAPIRAVEVRCLSVREQRVADLAARFGFGDAVLFPAPSPHGRARIALLVIGSSDSDFSKRFESISCRAGARDIAMALHERWTDDLRRELVQSSELSELDLRLLELELRGLRTKAIARELETTCASIDSRFQRLNGKLRVKDRRSAALRVLEFGLIAEPEHQPGGHSA